MGYRLFIDDERDPPKDGKEWVVARSSKEAIKVCERRGLPDFISFDHDLGSEDTSVPFVRWMIEACQDLPHLIFPQNYYVHSQNPIGAANITGLMESFISFSKA